MLSKRKSDARKMDTLECPVTPPSWRRETEAAGVSRFTKTECGKDRRLPGWGRQQGAEGGQPLCPGLSPFNSPQAHASALTCKAVLDVGEQ